MKIRALDAQAWGYIADEKRVVTLKAQTSTTVMNVREHTTPKNYTT